MQFLYQLFIAVTAVVVRGRGRIIAVLASVKGRIECIEVLAVQSVLSDAQRFTETGRLK